MNNCWRVECLATKYYDKYCHKTQYTCLNLLIFSNTLLVSYITSYSLCFNFFFLIVYHYVPVQGVGRIIRTSNYLTSKSVLAGVRMVIPSAQEIETSDPKSEC